MKSRQGAWPLARQNQNFELGKALSKARPLRAYWHNSVIGLKRSLG